MEKRRCSYPSTTSIAVESKPDFAKCEEVALVIVRKISGSSRASLALLPNELLIKILALLPLHTLLQLRLVCKSWNDPLLCTPFLWESWASNQYCWVVMVRKQKGLFAKEFLAFCLTTSEAGRGRRHGGHWLSLSSMLQSPQISPHLGGKYALRVMCRQVSAPYGILSLSFCQVAGAQGRMCFLIETVKQPPPPAATEELQETQPLYWDTFDDNQPSLLVVEVLTGATQMLPAPPLPERFQYTSFSLLSMSLLPSPRSGNHYHIVLYDSTLTYFDIYDSQSNSWTSVLGNGRNFKDCPASADVQHGDLFWLRKLCGATCEELVTYNLEANAWSKITVPSPSNAYGFCPLVTKCRGRIVFVDLLVAANLTVDGVGIWELQLSSSTPGVANWVLVVRSPPLYSKGFKFPPKNSLCLDIKFIAFGSLIFLTGGAHANFNYGAEFVHPLVYDFDLKSWYHLPAFGGSVEMLGLFAFSPLSSSK